MQRNVPGRMVQQQFGNSVVVPVFASVAKLMESRIKKIAADQKQLKSLHCLIDD